jgi:hypothetical protein
LALTPTRALALALLLIGAAWLAALQDYRPAAPFPPQAPPTQFSAARALTQLQSLVGDDVPHPIGSAAAERTRTRILTALRALGLEPELQGGVLVCGLEGVCGTPTNILARLPGSGDGADHAVLLDAHYDSVPAGPGASDDGVGVAALLEIARTLQHLPRPRQSIILLFADGEEADLLGARAFVHYHRWASTVSAAVNLDARGGSGPSLMFETGSDNRWLMQRYAAAIARPLTNSLYYAVYQLMPHSTDFTVYKQAGYQGFNFAFIGDVARYHTPLDDYRHASAASLQDQGQNALASVLALANAAPGPHAAGEAVFFDVFRAWLVRFPHIYVVPISLLLLALLAWVGLQLAQRRWLDARSLLWAAGALMGALVAGALAAVALLLALRGLGVVSLGGEAGILAHPFALEMSFAALGLGVIAVAGRVLSGGRPWAPTFAAVLLTALIGAALARWLRGGSYLGLLPAIAALIAILSALRRMMSAPLWPALTLCVVCFALLWPILVPVYVALGNEALVLIALNVIFAGFGLTALIAQVARPLQYRVIGTCALVSLAGVLIAMRLPAHTQDRPQPLTLRYLLQADRQQADWIADPEVNPLPVSVQRAGDFQHRPPPLYPWDRRIWSAPAPTLALAPPQLTLLSATPTDNGVHYRVAVRSAREAPRLMLRFTAQARVRMVEIASGAGDTTRSALALLPDGSSQWSWYGAQPQGLELSFDAPAQDVAGEVIDVSFALPPAGLPLQQSRPTTAVPHYDGDSTLVAAGFHLRP